MKTPSFSLLLLSAIFLSCFGLAKAQNCEAYYPMKTGAAFEMSHYSGKDKLESITSTTILEEANNGDVTSVTVQSTSKDAKGKETGTVNFEVTCQGDGFHLDMKSSSFGQSQQMQGMENVEMKMESEDMVFPKGLGVGSSLPDASMTMSASMNGMQIMNTTIKVINRKVTAKESITTSAGTFSCIVIEEDVESHMMGINTTSHNKAWYSLGVGTVRTENSKNGKMESYSVLTKISGN